MRVSDHSLDPSALSTTRVAPGERMMARSTAPRGHRMVQAIALAAHTTADTVCRPPCWRGATGVLTATIRVRHETRRGTPSPERHAPGLLPQLRRDLAAHRPPHHCARSYVQHWGEIPPAFCRPQGRDGPRPDRVRRLHLTLSGP